MTAEQRPTRDEFFSELREPVPPVRLETDIRGGPVFVTGALTKAKETPTGIRTAAEALAVLGGKKLNKAA